MEMRSAVEFAFFRTGETEAEKWDDDTSIAARPVSFE